MGNVAGAMSERNTYTREVMAIDCPDCGVPRLMRCIGKQGIRRKVNPCRGRVEKGSG